MNALSVIRHFHSLYLIQEQRFVSLVCCRNKLLVFCLCGRTLTDDAPHFYTDSYVTWLLALVEDTIAYSLLSSVLAVIVSGLP